MNEFALIQRYFAGLTPPGADVLLGIGDDAALLQAPPGEVLVVSTDTLVAGRHFPRDTPAEAVGWKALAVNLSDIAAMAATPRWVTLALTLPEVPERWLHAFAQGFATLARQYGVCLVGGDTTQGPLSITMTVLGSVPLGQALRRSGAKAGDALAVTGTLGDAALALQHWQQGRAVIPALRQRLDCPSPRLQEGLALRGLATAGLDVSDGLAGDLGHILHASGVGATLFAEALPRSAEFDAHAGDDALSLQLHGGDDYELLLTIPPQHLAEARLRLSALGTPLTVIGTIQPEPGLRLRHNGYVQTLEARGYQHF